jgi:hypothetical protein
MGFNNSIYKAYLDLATFGPMESMMYTREYFSYNKSTLISFRMFIILIIAIMICFLYFFCKRN